ncbi:MAG: WD40 repeat domain-containing protein [bacterium]
MKQILFVALAIFVYLAVATTAQETIDAPLRVFTAHENHVRSVDFSPDGTKILTASYDHTAMLWDVGSGKTLQVFSGHEGWIYSAAFSPDGTKILTGSADGTGKLWDTQTGHQVHTFTVDQSTQQTEDNAVLCVAFSPDGTQLLTGTSDEGTLLWDVATGERIRTFRGHVPEILSIAFSPDGTQFLAGDGGGTIELWDIASGERLLQYSQGARVSSVAFSPDGTRLLSASENGVVRLWDVTELAKPIYRREADLSIIESEPYGTSPVTGLHAVAFSPDGASILTGNTRNREAKLWDCATAQLLSVFKPVSGYSVAFSPDGVQILTDYHPFSAALWDARVEPSGVPGWEDY